MIRYYTFVSGKGMYEPLELAVHLNMKSQFHGFSYEWPLRPSLFIAEGYTQVCSPKALKMFLKWKTIKFKHKLKVKSDLQITSGKP